MNYIGDPDFQTDYWQPQDMQDNCAVAAQTSIINQFVNGTVSLEDSTYVAFSNGWYHPGFGTSMEDSGNLLEAYGISTHQVDNASVFDLATELQHGHRVIVGVNSNELWEQGPMQELWNWVIEKFGFDKAEFNPADHAITVTGIDTSDPANPQVIINDSGHPDGAAVHYPLDRFMDAWENSGFHYIATDFAPKQAVPPSFDVGDFLGLGTTLAVAAYTGDLVLAAETGRFVNNLCDQTDWDQLLAAI